MFISPFEIVTTVGLRKPYPNDWVKISHQKSSWISWTQKKIYTQPSTGKNKVKSPIIAWPLVICCIAMDIDPFSLISAQAPQWTPREPLGPLGPLERLVGAPGALGHGDGLICYHMGL